MWTAGSLFFAVLLRATLPVAQSADVPIYFAVGCFWHIQHEFVKAEEKLLGRHGTQLTSIVGYTGSKSQVQYCYMDGIDHAESVQVSIPEDQIEAFATVYFSLFVGKDRSHTNDRGPNYRAALGFPGGTSSPLMDTMRKAMKAATDVEFELREGLGDDADTLGKALIWVYDSEKFPFQQAEVYHQFHDDYILPAGAYPQEYNDLAGMLVCAGRLKWTPCREHWQLKKVVDCGVSIDRCKDVYGLKFKGAEFPDACDAEVTSGVLKAGGESKPITGTPGALKDKPPPSNDDEAAPPSKESEGGDDQKTPEKEDGGPSADDKGDDVTMKGESGVSKKDGSGKDDEGFFEKGGSGDIQEAPPAPTPADNGQKEVSSAGRAVAQGAPFLAMISWIFS